MGIPESYKGPLSLVAGLLIHTAFGSVYTLGAVTPYIASFLKYHGDPNIEVVDASINYPILLTAQNIGIIFAM